MLCQFAKTFPGVVSAFLESGRSLKRRFREESVTDMMMSSLIMLGGDKVFVDFPDEAVTGADMRWDFVNESTGKFFCIFVQAKQAYGKSKNWKRRNYRELLKRDVAGTLQARTLVDAAKSRSATFPLYAFYHSESLCLLAKSDLPIFEGVNLANGSEICRLAETAVDRSTRTKNKSVGVVARHFFSLSDIFCPDIPAVAGPFALSPSRDGVLRLVVGQLLENMFTPTRPEDVRSRLISALERNFDNTRVPELSAEIPAETIDLIEGQRREGGLLSAPVPYCHIVFLSKDSPLSRPLPKEQL